MPFEDLRVLSNAQSVVLLSCRGLRCSYTRLPRAQITTVSSEIVHLALSGIANIRWNFMSRMGFLCDWMVCSEGGCCFILRGVRWCPLLPLLPVVSDPLPLLSRCGSGSALSGVCQLLVAWLWGGCSLTSMLWWCRLPLAYLLVFRHRSTPVLLFQ